MLTRNTLCSFPRRPGSPVLTGRMAARPCCGRQGRPGERAFIKEPSMTCPKCRAIMFQEPSLHHQASADYTVDLSDARLVCASWHCLLCGTYCDHVILANRAKQADERRLVAQAETIATWATLDVPEGVRS